MLRPQEEAVAERDSTGSAATGIAAATSCRVAHDGRRSRDEEAPTSGEIPPEVGALSRAAT